MARSDVRASARSAAVALAALLLLFAGRVLAQLIQLLWPNDLLPAFAEWQSGTLPYGVLLASQIAIIAVSAWLIAKIRTGALKRRPRVGAGLLALGLIYLAFMSFRLVAGLTFLAGTPFFGAVLPAIFHLVLATMLIITGRQLRHGTSQ